MYRKSTVFGSLQNQKKNSFMAYKIILEIIFFLQNF